jgi:hypothetical protein
MGNFFPRWTNWLPLKLAIAVVFIVLGVAVAMPYYATPKYTRVGYQPTQPVPFSHKIHVGQNGMDCRFCHSFGERSSHSNVPTNQVCFNCHGAGKGQIKLSSPKLEPVRKAAETGEPLKWVKIHKAPDYVYFNHSAHLNRGVSCVSCHGKINEMEVVHHAEPQSMGWCLDCHRNPENKIRPLTEITNLNWKPEDVNRESFYKDLLDKKFPASDIAAAITGEEHAKGGDLAELVKLAEGKYGKSVTQKEVGLQLKKHWQVSPPQDCTTCHR